MQQTVKQIIKGDTGVLDHTEDVDKLRWWAICGPKVARLVREYEDTSVLRKNRRMRRIRRIPSPWRDPTVSKVFQRIL